MKPKFFLKKTIIFLLIFTLIFLFLRTKRIIVQNSTENDFFLELIVNKTKIYTGFIEGTNSERVLSARYFDISPLSLSNEVSIFIRTNKDTEIKEKVYLNGLLNKGIIINVENQKGTFSINHSRNILFTPYIQ